MSPGWRRVKTPNELVSLEPKVGGLDRTGVIVAALLSALDIAAAPIAEEYELSDGPLHPDLLAGALECFSQCGYFRGIDVGTLRERFP